MSRVEGGKEGRKYGRTERTWNNLCLKLVINYAGAQRLSRAGRGRRLRSGEVQSSAHKLSLPEFMSRTHELATSRSLGGGGGDP